MNDKLSEIVQGYVEEAEIDYVGLWQIIIRVRYDLGIVDQTELRKIVLQIVRELLAAGLEAVTLRDIAPVRVAWENQDIGYVLDRIRQQWDILGRDPNPGEIVWFDRKSVEQA
jgi:hypothetical protein